MAALKNVNHQQMFKALMVSVAASLLCGNSTVAAPMLYGYVSDAEAANKTTHAGESSAVINRAQTVPSTAPNVAPIYTQAQSQQRAGYAAPASPRFRSPSAVPSTAAQGFIANAYASQVQRDPLTRFQGTWQSVTVVTDSLVPTVSTGQQVVSTMEFAKSDQGRLFTKWDQPGWNESQSAITVVSQNDFVIDRTSYFTADRSKSWATRSRDSYNMLDDTRILATSEVDQYVDGRFIGRYCTRSVLVKISDSTSIALR